MTVETEVKRARAYYPAGREHGPVRAVTPGWDTGPERRFDDGRILARALGWFSVGLGLFQLAAPGRLTRLLDIDEDYDPLVRLYGARELAQGMAILSERTPTAGVRSRVGGDVLDLATLGVALARGDARRERAGIAAAAVTGVMVLDVLAARQLSRQDRRPGGPARDARGARAREEA